ncbi:MAG: hypothetical protein Q4B79_05885 [Moraxella sp.]|uniref:hypothetical protein n=1 Tax=Moraxella sp. TaxID=479 RepID=UPI0026DC6755|nr:hypothetical protein [Moraxella sp.]MDO4450472.1 hypothetical protein [Moraxella sp.]
MNARLSHWLRDNLDSFDDSIQIAVMSFMAHVETSGLKDLQGRNKSSAPPNLHTKKEHRHAKFAQKYCLWHRACLPFIAPFVFGDISEVK